jgi:hypothetical protein
MSKKMHSILRWSGSGISGWIRIQIKLMRIRNTGSRCWSWYLQVSDPAPGRTKVVYIVIIHLDQDQASGLNQYHENLTFSLKSCANQAEVRGITFLSRSQSWS